MKKSRRTLVAQVLTFETALPFDQVIARLDKELNKAESAQFLSNFRKVETKSELENLVHACLGDRDFLYFLEMNHSKWLGVYGSDITTPSVVYTIGNPLLAAAIMQHDIVAGYQIPPRVIIFQKNNITTVMYHLPSSLIELKENPELNEALEVLDFRMESMMTRITVDSAD